MKLLRYPKVQGFWLGKLLFFSVVSAIAMTAFVLDASALTLSPIVSTAPTEKPYSIAVDQDTGAIFVVVGQLDPTAANGISRVTGSTLTSVYSNIYINGQPMNYTNGLTAGDGYLYWGNNNIGPGTSSLTFKASQDGSGGIANIGGGGAFDISDITYQDGYIYNSDYAYGRIRRHDTNGSNIQYLGQPPWSGYWEQFVSIAVSSDRIFAGKGDGIYSFPITGGSPTILATGNFSDIAFYDDMIYAIGGDHDSIWQISASGDPASLLLGGDEFGSLNAIAAYDGMLYVTDTGLQTIWQVDLDAEPIPEPATMFLLGSGLFGLAGFRRKKFKK